MTKRPIAKRPVDAWRHENISRLLNLIDADNKKAKRVLCAAIAKVFGGDENETNEHFTRIVNEKTPLGGEWLQRIELGAQRLVSEGRFSSDHVEIGFLDNRPESPTIAYILVKVRVNAWKEIYSSLKDIPEIKEAALVLGGSGVDAIIKIEASIERLNDILLKSISMNPNIHTTQTLQVLPYSHWQKYQYEHIPQLDKLPCISLEVESGDSESLESSKRGIKKNDYPSDRIRKLFLHEWNAKLSDLKKIQNGVAILKRKGTLNQFPEIVVDAAIYRLLAVVVWHERGRGEEERTNRYISAQAARIQRESTYKNSNFEIRRIFVLDDPAKIFLTNNDLRDRIGKEIEIGVNVRYIDIKKLACITYSR